MSRNSVYVRVVLVVMVLAILLSFMGRNTQAPPRDAWVPSSFNAVGAGSRAFFQTLDDLHWPVERWREPLSRLTARGTGNEIIITRSAIDYRVPFTPEEGELLANWVASGNTLVLFGSLSKWEDTRDLLSKFGITAPVPPEDSTLFDSFRIGPERKIEAQPSAGQNGRLVLPERSSLVMNFPASARVLWAADGAPVVVEMTHGKGRLVCVASDKLLGNAYLSQGDNLAIVTGLLAPGGHAPTGLFFEERHHGYSPAFAVAQLAHHPGVRLAALLAVLGALTFLGSAFVRFGPVLPLEPTTGRSSLDFVDSIAALYHRADLRNDMMGFLFDDTRLHVIHRLHLPDTATHEIIAARLKQAFPALPGWKKLAQRFDSPDYVAGLPPGGWLRVARELIEIKTAVA